LSTRRLLVLPDAEAVAVEVAAQLAEAAAAGGQLALAGGSGPKRAYQLASGQLEDWSRATLWMGDERHVPAGDERSNARMVREELLAPLPESGRPVFEEVRTELPLEEAAVDYEVRLRGALRDGAGLDLVLLGVGPDGHTASLFPGKPAVQEEERLVVGVPEAGMEPHVPRVSMTLPVFAAARRVVFIVTGEAKADAAARAFGDPPDLSAPSAHVRPRTGELLLVLDEAAAARLPRG
jgi:6-phosphogluconolactonase